MHTGKPLQYSQAPVMVTMRPATVNASTAKNKTSTHRANDALSEYFISF